MEDDILSPGTMLGFEANSAMDFDCMDELLLEGCWLDLETTAGSEFWDGNPNSAAFFDTSFTWPTLGANDSYSASTPSQKSNQEDKQISISHGNSHLNELRSSSSVTSQSVGKNMFGIPGWETSVIDQPSEIGRRWWIGPMVNPGPGTSLRERLIRALEYIKDFAKDKGILVQLWVPVNTGGKRILTTHNQPFALDPSCGRLANYRDISVNYQFSAEEDSKDIVGLPGRVFLGRVPEWTPDVRFFRSDEYPRVDHAQQYDVRGTLALPVFEQGSKTCLGVIEVVMTTQKIKYHPELESVCKALEAVDLRSSEFLSNESIKVCNMPYEAALPEIQEVLKAACETHKLPLAQTWVSCIQQGKGGSRHSDENYSRCVSTVDHSCYVADPSFQGFHEACSEHHLLRGQGLVGEAVLTNQPCFSSDITSYCKTEYPLSHHARTFRLRAAVAIRLRSVHTGAADFVLEFFLPVDCRDPEAQKKMLTSLSIIIEKVYRTLRVVTDKELMEEKELLISKVVVPSDDKPSREETFKVKHSYPQRFHRDTSGAASLTEVQPNVGVVRLCQKQKHMVMLDEKSIDCRHNQDDVSLKGTAEYDGGDSSLAGGSEYDGGDSSLAGGCFSSVSVGKTGQKRRTRAEKTITLQVLRQYFAGSLKEAAKSIGVCPTTLKRICRQYGIKRWPSRKIKKVGHSLQKLQVVIDSVHGGSGAFEIGSFYTKFPELASPDVSSTILPSGSKMGDHPEPSTIQPMGDTSVFQLAAPKSPSTSCSHSSSSSHSCSSGTKQHSFPSTAACEDPVLGEKLTFGVLKRVRSETELRASSQEERKPLPRSQSHKSLVEQPSLRNRPPLPYNGSRVHQEVGAQRVKVTYRNEKIRFRLPNDWGFKDLLREIGRRFNIDDFSKIDLKYLDDDSEWVLLTCDDDLEECVDVCQSSQGHTIKLQLQVSPHLSGRLFGSNGPS